MAIVEALVDLAVGDGPLCVVRCAVAQALMLPLIGVGTVYLRYRRTDARIGPSKVSDFFLWISFGSMALLGVYKLGEKFREIWNWMFG